MPNKNLKKEIDVSCLLDPEVRNLVARELRQISGMSIGIWQNGNILIVPTFEGEEKYYSGIFAALADELPSIAIDFDAEKEEITFGFFGLTGSRVIFADISVPLKAHPASARAMLKLWKAEYRKEVAAWRKRTCVDARYKRRRKSKYTGQWMENVCHMWIDSLYKGLEEILSAVPHENLHCDNADDPDTASLAFA
jgi:hypothetical protein